MSLRFYALTAAVVVTALAAPRPAAAHKGHHPSPSPSAVAASPAAGAASPQASAGAGAEPASPAPAPAAPASPAPPKGIDWRAGLFEHRHNKIVHFPIALGLTAAVLLLGRSRWEVYQPVAATLLAVAAVFAMAAYLTGGAQAEPFMGTAAEGLVKQHATQGTVTALLLVTGAILTRVRAVQRWLWLYALFLILAISFTGLLGGLVAHGDM